MIMREQDGNRTPKEVRDAIQATKAPSIIRKIEAGKLLNQINIEDGENRRQRMISDLMNSIQID